MEFWAVILARQIINILEGFLDNIIVENGIFI